MATPKTVLELERNDLQGALALYWAAKDAGRPLSGDDLRVIALSFDDGGDAFVAAVMTQTQRRNPPR